MERQVKILCYSNVFYVFLPMSLGRRNIVPTWRDRDIFSFILTITTGLACYDQRYHLYLILLTWTYAPRVIVPQACLNAVISSSSSRMWWRVNELLDCLLARSLVYHTSVANTHHIHTFPPHNTTVCIYVNFIVLFLITKWWFDNVHVQVSDFV